MRSFAALSLVFVVAAACSRDRTRLVMYNVGTSTDAAPEATGGGPQPAASPAPIVVVPPAPAASPPAPAQEPAPERDAARDASPPTIGGVVAAPGGGYMGVPASPLQGVTAPPPAPPPPPEPPATAAPEQVASAPAETSVTNVTTTNNYVVVPAPVWGIARTTVRPFPAVPPVVGAGGTTGGPTAGPGAGGISAPPGWTPNANTTAGGMPGGTSAGGIGPFGGFRTRR